MNFRHSLFILFLIQVLLPAKAIEQRNYLQNSASLLSDNDLLEKDYTPYPAYEDRAYWEALPEEIRKECIREAEESSKYNYGSVPLTSYLEYKRTGSRASSEKFYQERNGNLKNLILGELCEGKGRFLDPIMNAVWSICEQSTWAVSAHLVIDKRAKRSSRPK